MLNIFYNNAVAFAICFYDVIVAISTRQRGMLFMFGFFFKKNFYDGWDNVLLETVPNLIFDVFLFLGAMTLFLAAKLNLNHAITNNICIIIWAATILLLFIIGSILVLDWALTAREIAAYEATELKDFFIRLPSCLLDGVLFGFLLFILSAVTIFGLCYYFKLTPKRLPNGIWYIGVEEGSVLPFVGLAAGSVFAWVALSVFQMMFFYPAVRAVIGNGFRKSLKKCFIIFLDNLGASMLLMIHNFVLFAISVVMLGLLPGLSGIGLARVNFVRLVIKKYDYATKLQNAGKAVPSKVPWKEVLEEDVRVTGNRSLKTFFFPWKE